MSIGKIHDGKTLMLRFHVGTGELGNDKYDLALSNAQTPIITNERTRKCYTLSWDDILNMAISAGIDQPQSPQPEEQQ